MSAARVKGKGAAHGSSTHSGRLLLRMDPELHAELARAAESDGQSLNAYITRVLGDEVNGVRVPDPGTRLAGRLIHTAVIADLVLVVAWP